MPKPKWVGRAKAHIRYKQLSGKIVAGITTILSILTDANILARWANKLGLQDIDSTKYVDELASIGTLVHYLIECDLLKKEPVLGDYSQNQIDQARMIFKKYENWKSQHKLVVIAMERPLTSEQHEFGGTGDFFGLLDDKMAYVDFKTSKACYLNHKVQAVACAKLWEEKVGDKIEDIRILRFGRNEAEGFEEIHIGLWDLRWELFKACLNVYVLKKKIEKLGG